MSPEVVDVGVQLVARGFELTELGQDPLAGLLLRTASLVLGIGARFGAGLLGIGKQPGGLVVRG